ncbi:uncharacterized protein LOC132196152 [Neocloeon triangulifer]|uniref:uncharacterized protein LOC132196152 n=1 Tax=Neocloeon triangulifer TaxID=2078957 RepID=UPI00286EDDF1|nr:uncharacterized protein LOC132196152 [Neocloeon triangulifer]
MVERLHRTLKAALMCQDADWMTALPLVLLGLRSVFKEDLNTTPSLLVYGEELRLPGTFFVRPTPQQAADLAAQLRHHFATLLPIPAAHHGGKSFFVHPDLATATHVFLRTDAVRGALEKPYTGPYPVVMRHAKSFVIEVKGKPKVVTIDRLKPCYQLSEKEPVPKPAEPPRRVRFNLPAAQPATPPATPSATPSAPDAPEAPPDIPEAPPDTPPAAPPAWPALEPPPTPPDHPRRPRSPDLDSSSDLELNHFFEQPETPPAPPAPTPAATDGVRHTRAGRQPKPPAWTKDFHMS